MREALPCSSTVRVKTRRVARVASVDEAEVGGGKVENGSICGRVILLENARHDSVVEVGGLGGPSGHAER